jgi:hypothetical protein
MAEQDLVFRIVAERVEYREERIWRQWEFLSSFQTNFMYILVFYMSYNEKT